MLVSGSAIRPGSIQDWTPRPLAAVADFPVPAPTPGQRCVAARTPALNAERAAHPAPTTAPAPTIRALNDMPPAHAQAADRVRALSAYARAATLA